MKSSPTKTEKYTIEFAIKSSPVILFELLSTTSGLAQWFANRVTSRQDVFTFYWEGVSQKAKMLEQVENELIRYQWEDSAPEEFFEFKISATEITGDTVLYVTDFARPDEMNEEKLLWESEIHELSKRLGGL